MFAFADETGNSGRNIFDQNEYFRLGAILATTDIAPVAKAAMTPFLEQQGVDRFHAHEWPEETVAELGHAVLDVLDKSGAWVFSLTEIHKPYMAPTKFVDVIFDAGENKAVPGKWYWDELNRHVLCLTIDRAMSRDTAKLFWDSYLVDDFTGIVNCVDLVDAALDRRAAPPAVLDVIGGAFDYARQRPADFTLANTQKRKGYQANTPNVVAFTRLFQAIHDFAAKETSPPERLVHDQQDEFRKTLAETYAKFGSIIWHDSSDGAFPDASLAEYELARFEMPSSKDNAGLQATDLLLWVAQRTPRSIELLRLKDTLKGKTDDFTLSRRMSELIVHVHLLRHERRRAERNL